MTYDRVYRRAILCCAATLIACRSRADAAAGDASGAEQGTVVTCPTSPAAESGPDFPNYLPPDQLPDGKACDEAAVCMVPIGTPCPDPSELPEVTTYRCTCESGQWTCAIAFSSHSICTNEDGGAIYD